MSGDWLTQAIELVQETRRDLRLTLPPGQHDLFWNRLLERLEYIPNPLTLRVLLPSDPLAIDGLRRALSALEELEKSRHTVVLAASDIPFPYFLLIADRENAIGAVGDAYNGDDLFLVQTIEDPHHIAELINSFERRAAEGIAEPNAAAWLEWLDKFPEKKPAKSAVSMLERGQTKLERIVRRRMQLLPKRGFWLIKPRPAAWSMADEDGPLPERWIEQNRAFLGWPRLAATFQNDIGSYQLQRLNYDLAEHYPSIEDAARVRATARAFLDDMQVNDRIVAMDGWTVKQETPVDVYCWGTIESEPLFQQRKWPLCRKVRWRETAYQVPVTLIREATGLSSATHPIHRLPPASFHALIDVIENRHDRGMSTQMSLTLDLFPQNGEELE